MAVEWLREHLLCHICFFADDSLLFFKANIQEASIVKQCLIRYEKLSGQVVNYNKSSICFSRNTQGNDRDQVADCLEVVQAANFGKYLGLPSFVGRRKRVVFAYVEDKIKQRIGSWNKKLLSQAGFKELRAFNLAMLEKQAWRFLTNPSTLAARIYKARYFSTTSFVDATIGNCSSFCWRSIMAAHDLVCARIRRRIGNGQTTLIWGHPWLPDNPSPLVQTIMPEELREALVAGLIDPQTKTWDPHILSDLFVPDDVNRISMNPISPDYEDSWYWMGNPSGEYTVKNAYRQEQVGVAVGVLYHIWRARNSAVWDKALPQPGQTWRRANTAENAYRQVHHRQQHPAPSALPTAETHTRLKCFVDAGYKQTTGDATYGMVLLGHDGSFVAAKFGKLPGAFSPLMAEALACKEALS
ncbi:PREDICTED: uncharacterized protein LOC109173059 [Ipomoea nil]|uniref:uncharacterized protein LOC109173059 n=1 Tax=Ipomoea nil TaxID=35883 RepID=UPI000901FCB3|nr:PREDICTED: uncharacterized protein LOC109173059 [Ipomoea nil]